MKIEIYNENWTKEYVMSNSDKIFVFGDNNARIGKGGQATIRGLENAVGIRTKKGPSKKAAAFYTDKELADNKSKIDEDILNIKRLSILGKTIVFSKNGYGTGLASLKQKAPKTFDYLCESLKFNFGFDNEKGTKWSKIPGYDEISKGIYITMDKKSAFENGILQPTTNSFFRSELLEKNLNTIFDLIKNGKKVAFTQNKFYKNDSVLIFVIPGLNEYLVVRVSSSYKVKKLDKKMWGLFEGYNDKYIDTISDVFESDDYYQTHFEFICSLDQSGRMIFRDDIFGGYDKPKVKIDKKKYSESIKEDEDISMNNEESTSLLVNEEKVIFKEPLIPELPEVVEEKELSRKELLDIIEDLKSEIKKIKTPWYVKIFNQVKQKISRKSLEYILDKKDLKGDLTIIDNIFNKEKNKTYYKLVTDKYTHFLVFHKGIFSNKVYIILTFTHE